MSPSNLHEGGVDVNDHEAFEVAPKDADLERAIASVPGVANALVRRSAATGRSRLRIRVAAGEDPRRVSWAVAATLRERFSIVLDPDDIRPRVQVVPPDAAADAPELSPERPALAPSAEEGTSAEQERGTVRPSGDDTHGPEPERELSHDDAGELPASGPGTPSRRGTAPDPDAGRAGPADEPAPDPDAGRAGPADEAAPVPDAGRAGPADEAALDPPDAGRAGPADEPGQGRSSRTPDELISEVRDALAELSQERADPVTETGQRRPVRDEPVPGDPRPAHVAPEAGERRPVRDAPAPGEPETGGAVADEQEASEAPDEPATSAAPGDGAAHHEVTPGQAEPHVTAPADEATEPSARSREAPDPAERSGRRSERSRPRVGPPWPVSADRSSRWMRREDPPFTTVTGEAARGHGRRAADPTGTPPADEPRFEADEPRLEEEPGRDRTSPSDPAASQHRRDQVSRASGGAARQQPPTRAAGERPAPPATDENVSVPPAASHEHSGVTGEIRSRRAAIRHLDTRREERDVRITATLEQGGRSARGEVTTVPTTRGVFRAVAEATIEALGRLVGPELVAGVDHVSVHPADDPANVMVAVSLVTERGEEALLGTSVVRGDPEHAVMRATLDALNRRVGELTAAGGPAA